MRKIYMADSINPGMPMSMAPGMRKKNQVNVKVNYQKRKHQQCHNVYLY